MATLLASPAYAANWQEQAAYVRPGAFVGAQFKVPLGDRSGAKPRAELAFAPTQSRISGGGMVRTRIGEGLALSLAPRSKPSVTLAGSRADLALGLTPRGQTKADHKLGLSTGGVVAIGVGVAVLGFLAFALYVRESEKGAD
jgi:hypothetical protein